MKTMDQMAREAGLKHNLDRWTSLGMRHVQDEDLHKFFVLVRAEAMEKAAQTCDLAAVLWPDQEIAIAAATLAHQIRQAINAGKA